MYGTPLYVMSQDIMLERIDALKAAFEAENIDYEINFAGKAFINTGICRLIKQAGIHLDTASGGELYTALRAGFDPGHITFHGSNKSEQEICEALTAGVGKFVVDSEQELERVNKTAAALDKQVDILFRINPGVEAHTNELINTGKTDTKFGLPIENCLSVIERVKTMPNIHLVGLHSHIGSQIVDEAPFLEASKKMLKLYKALTDDGFALRELDLGGGFGIAYLKTDPQFDVARYIPKLVRGLKDLCRQYDMALPKLSIEPGRFIAAEAGITLYTVGTVKTLENLRTYVSVDGGMADNPRPALYDAAYEAVVCDRPMTPGNKTTVRVSGKACETDTLIAETDLAAPQVGDTLAVLKTGAYNYTMASNYNRLPKPAVVLLNGEKSAVLCARESYEDVVRQDRIPEWLED